jgi:hypothetical protein
MIHPSVSGCGRYAHCQLACTLDLEIDAQCEIASRRSPNLPGARAWACRDVLDRAGVHELLVSARFPQFPAVDVRCLGTLLNGGHDAQDARSLLPVACVARFNGRESHCQHLPGAEAGWRFHNMGEPSVRLSLPDQRGPARHGMYIGHELEESIMLRWKIVIRQLIAA